MNSSKFRGVTRVKKRKQLQWQAEVRVDGVRHCLGRFVDEHSAAQAYDDALREHQTKLRWRELNFPREGEQKVGTGDSSRFRGVTRTRSGKWEAKIRVGAEVRYLGCYGDDEAAARAFDRAAVELRGILAKTNFSHEPIHVAAGNQAAEALLELSKTARDDQCSAADTESRETVRRRGGGTVAKTTTHMTRKSHDKEDAVAAAAATLPKPGDRIDYSFKLKGASAVPIEPRWFPGKLVRYDQRTAIRSGHAKKRRRNGEALAGYGKSLGEWGLVAFDDGKTLSVRLRPSEEGVVWRQHSSCACGTEQLHSSVFADDACGLAAKRRMRAKQWQTDCSDEPLLDRRQAFPIYTASSGIDRSPNGFGCFAAQPLSIGQFIAEYSGEIICDDETERKRRSHSEYIFDIGDGLAVDAMRKGNPTRRINHCSSAPNTRAVVTNHRGVRKVCVYAIEEIAANTELCFDYGSNFWSCEE